MTCHNEGLRLADWLICHQERVEDPCPQIVGHIHPRLRSPRPAPCYVVGPSRIILPAFSDDAAGFNMTGRPSRRNRRCFPIIGNSVSTLTRNPTLSILPALVGSLS
jgi:metallophosphoesterase superfamily enzyme